MPFGGALARYLIELIDDSIDATIVHGVVQSVNEIAVHHGQFRGDLRRIAELFHHVQKALANGDGLIEKVIGNITVEIVNSHFLALHGVDVLILSRGVVLVNALFKLAHNARSVVKSAHIKTTEVIDMASMGHNSGEVGGIAAEALRQFVERIERLSEEKSSIQSDIKDVYAQAKSQGFDVKVLRRLISLRKMDSMEREELEQIEALYRACLGMA